MEPYISVIMPVYNSEAYLAEAIESVLNQTFPDFEFLIFNDGSTDNSEKIINSYTDNRIKFFNDKVNTGYTAKLNQGITVSRGKYIARMDSDDICDPERFKNQVSFLDANRNIAACGTFMEFINNKNEVFNWVSETDPELLRINLLFDCAICHPTVMFRSDLIKKESFFYNPTLEPCEDYDMWVRISEKFSLANLDKVLLKYRISGNQISNKKNELQRKYKFQAIKKQLQALKVYPSEVELRIHDHIFFSSVILSADYMPKVKQWLKKLKDANDVYHVYDKKKFTVYLAKLLQKNEQSLKEQVSTLSGKDWVAYHTKKIINWKSIKT